MLIKGLKGCGTCFPPGASVFLQTAVVNCGSKTADSSIASSVLTSKGSGTDCPLTSASYILKKTMKLKIANYTLITSHPLSSATIVGRLKGKFIIIPLSVPTQSEF